MRKVLRGLFPFISVLLLFFLPFCLLANTLEAERSTVPTAAREETNVLIITVDTLRTDRVSVYSEKYLRTQHIDSFASQGIVFTRAFAHNPVTLPSHVNILTGTSPLFHGISDNAGYTLDDNFLTLAEYLKDRSYSTGAFVGAFPLDSRFGLAQGFDIYNDSYGTRNPLEFFFVERRAEDVINLAVEWIKKQKNKFFCWIHLFDPHQPYLPPSPYAEEHKGDLYSGEVAYVDDQLGKLFEFLREKQIFENTIIVFTSDHGEGLGDHGERTHSYFAYNSTIHVPLIVHIPGMAGTKIHTNVCHLDIFPTICEALGLEIPEHLQGESLIPIISGNNRKDSVIYIESLSPYLNRGWAPLKGFIKGDTKYIDQPIEEVYDLSEDFSELNNIAEKTDLTGLKECLHEIENNLKNKNLAVKRDRIDRETLKNLQTLGYVSGTSSSTKSHYTKKDDLKILLPLQNKMLDAVGLSRVGHTEKAISLLREVISESESFVVAYKNLAVIYRETGRVADAVEVLREGLANNKDKVSIMSALGITLTEAGKFEEAIKILNQCIEIEEFNPEYWNYLGVAYYNSGNFKSAIEAYKKAIELDSDYALAYNNIGSIYLNVYMRSNNRMVYKTAVRNFKKAIDLDPSLASAYNGLGSAYIAEGNIDDAILLWEKSLELMPDYSYPLYNLGKAYLKKGERDKALEYFESYKEKYYNTLSPKEKEDIEELILECQKKRTN